jgi:hypothetical protein
MAQLLCLGLGGGYLGLGRRGPIPLIVELQMWPRSSMDRAFGFYPKGCRFKSCRGHHPSLWQQSRFDSRRAMLADCIQTRIRQHQSLYRFASYDVRADDFIDVGESYTAVPDCVRIDH